MAGRRHSLVPRQQFSPRISPDTLGKTIQPAFPSRTRGTGTGRLKKAIGPTVPSLADRSLTLRPPLRGFNANITMVIRGRAPKVNK